MLEAALTRLLNAKQGNKEFALFHLAGGKWMAEIGNPSKWAMLGEVQGEFRSEPQDTPLKAVQEVIALVATMQDQPKEPHPWRRLWGRRGADCD